MDTYENIIIGQFLLSLGVRMGLDNHAGNIPWICPSLLQQTPLDTRLGDLLVFNSSFFRVIEFKRASNDSAKEQQKLESLSAALAVSELSDLSQVSRRIHWYVKTDTRSDLQTWVVPYLDFPGLESREHFDYVDLSTFISDTARQASTGQTLSEAETEQCRKYLDVVYHSYASRAATSSSSGTLILQTSAGGLQHLLVPDLLEVLRTPREVFERMSQHSMPRERMAERVREAERVKEAERIRENVLEHKLSPAKELSRGLDFEHGIGR